MNFRKQKKRKKENLVLKQEFKQEIKQDLLKKDFVKTPLENKELLQAGKAIAIYDTHDLEDFCKRLIH